MRALYDGVENNTDLTAFKEADGVINVVLLGDDGLPIDLTGETIFIEVQANKVRATEVKSLTGVLHQALGGSYTVTLEPTGGADNIMDFGPGTYYLFAYRIDGGGNRYYADGNAIVAVA